MRNPTSVSGEGLLFPTSRTSPRASNNLRAPSCPPPAFKLMALSLVLILLVGVFLILTPTASAAPESSDENMIGATLEASGDQHEYSLILLGGTTVTSVRIFVTREVTQPNIEVKELETPPTYAKAPPPTAESFLEITTNLQENYEIISATIEFKVSKSWMEKNGVTENSIKVWRLNDEWQELSTTLSDVGPSYLYFEAQSPGFSLFALSGVGTPPPASSPPLLLYTAVAAGVGAAGFSLFYWFRRRRMKPSISLEAIKRTVLGGREKKPEVSEEELAKKLAQLRKSAGGPLKEELKRIERESRAKLGTRSKTEREERAELLEKLKEAAKKREEE